MCNCLNNHKSSTRDVTLDRRSIVSGKNHKQEQEEQLSQIDGSENGAASVLSTATPSTTASRPTAVTAQFPAFRPNSGFGFGFLHVAFSFLYCTTVPVLPILPLTFPPDGRSNSHSILRHLFYSASRSPASLHSNWN